MPRLTRQQSHAQTRDRLIAAAWEEIANKGVAAASVRSISDAAGYSQGAFYSSFDSKEALLLHLLRGHFASTLSHFGAVPERIQAKIKKARGAGVTRLVIEEMDVFFSSTNPGATFATVTIELQMHANRSDAFAAHYHKARIDFQTEFGKTMGRILDFLPSRPIMDPADLALSLAATAVGFSTMGPELSQDKRQRILSAFFRGVIGSAGHKR